MKRLSKAQQKVIDDMKKSIDRAREDKTAEDWFDENNHCNYANNTAEKFKANERPTDIIKWDFYQATWENYIQAICVVQAKTETIRVLVERGLIRVLEEASFKGGYETVQLIEY